MVSEARPDTGLRVGDRLVAIDGDGSAAIGWYSARLHVLPVGAHYTMEVDRDGERVETSIGVGELRSRWNLAGSAIFVILGLGFLATGWTVGIVRPEHRVARKMAVAWLAIGAGLLHQVLHPLLEYLTTAELLLNFASEYFLFLGLAAMYAFYYEFPGGVGRGRLWTAVEIVLFAWAGVISAALAVRQPALLSGELVVTLLGIPYLSTATAFDAVVELYVVAALAAMFAVVIRNYVRAREPDRRRRVRWIVYATTASIAPYLLASVLAPRSSAAVRGPEAYSSLETFAAAMLVLIPLSTSYAVVRHRLFDIHFVIRRTVHYAIAKGLLHILLVLPVVGLAVAVLLNPNLTLGQMLFSRYGLVYAPLLAAAALAMRFRASLTRWVDRQFFRADYNREEILYRLLGRIGGVERVEDLAAFVAGEIESALGPDRFFFVTAPDERSNFCVWLPTAPEGGEVSFSRHSQLVAILAHAKGAVTTRSLARSGLDGQSFELLTSLGVDLVVPLLGAEERLDGLLLLGAKGSEEPYSDRDRRLLVAVGGQVALSLEAIELRGHVERERQLTRDVLSKIEAINVDLTRECQVCGRCYDAPTEICPRDKGLVRPTLPVARTIDGRYRLERLLGKGGVGSVYEASDLRLGRSVAFKLLVADLFGDGAALRRFEREARVCARLSHPNIVTVFDYGRLGGHGAYIVMERLEGYTLRAVLKRAGRVSGKLAARWFDDLMRGVAAAHEVGVIHRDLKPENVFVCHTTDGFVGIKVLDFGLGKALREDANTEALTRSGTVVGTVRYMSPEQLTGAPVDFRTDIFAIGVMIVEAVTGRRPFGGSAPTEILARIESGELGLDDSTPEAQALKGALSRALAADADRRYASIEEMRAAVIPALLACEQETTPPTDYPDDAATYQ